MIHTLLQVDEPHPSPRDRLRELLQLQLSHHDPASEEEPPYLSLQLSKVLARQWKYLGVVVDLGGQVHVDDLGCLVQCGQGSGAPLDPLRFQL